MNKHVESHYVIQYHYRDAQIHSKGRKWKCGHCKLICRLKEGVPHAQSLDKIDLRTIVSRIRKAKGTSLSVDVI